MISNDLVLVELKVGLLILYLQNAKADVLDPAPVASKLRFLILYLLSSS